MKANITFGAKQDTIYSGYFQYEGEFYLFYNIAKFILIPIFKLINRMQVIGLENLPDSGPLILVSNHVSYWDPIVLGAACPKKVCFVAKEELFKIPVVGTIIKNWGAIPVKRGRSDRETIGKWIEALEHGKTIGIFIEGTRNRKNPDQMLPPRPGPAMLAIKTGASLIPVALINSSYTLKSFRKVTVVFGEPMTFRAETTENESQKMIYDRIGRQLTEEIMKIKKANQK